MITPRLLTAAQARRYLGGMEPAELGISAAGSVRGQVRYDRVLIDAKLDQRSGLNRSSAGDDPESALQSWIEQQSHGAA